MTRALRVLHKRWRQITSPWRALGRSFKIIASLPARLDRLERTLAEHRREARVLHASSALPSKELWQNRLHLTADSRPASNALRHSTGCRQDDFEQPWFSYWTKEFHVTLLYHRKLWEYVFICEALWERGALVEGSRGLGFGVGSEPLSPWFAAHGCAVVATDMSAEDAAAIGWAESQQHGLNPDKMQWPSICSRETFDSQVDVRVCDMNHIDPELVDFDFCWSSCALEHLGSIEAGLAFVENSLSCLKPGGWAVHTTEFNLSSNEDTLESGDTVLFRRQDFEALLERLNAKGHNMMPLDFDPGFGVVDNFVDVPPYRAEPCLKIALAGYGSTSFALIVQRGS